MTQEKTNSKETETTETTENIMKLMELTLRFQMLMTKQSFYSGLVEGLIKEQKSAVHKHFLQVEAVFSILDLFRSTLFNRGATGTFLFMQDNSLYGCSLTGLQKLSKNDIDNLMNNLTKED